MFTSTGRSLGVISRRKERSMGEDGKRKERHIENGGWEGGTGGEGCSHEQEEAEHRAWMPAGLCLAREAEKSLHGYFRETEKWSECNVHILVRIERHCMLHLRNKVLKNDKTSGLYFVECLHHPRCYSVKPRQIRYFIRGNGAFHLVAL